MRRTIGISLVATLSIFAFGCNNEGPEAQREALQESAEALRDKSENVANQYQDTRENLGEARQDLNKQQSEVAGMQQALTEPLAAARLQEVFPEKSGWTRTINPAETQTEPYRHSKASATYLKEDDEQRSQITLTVVDGGYHPAMTQPYTNLLTAGYTQSGAQGAQERNITVDDNYPGWERWEGRDDEKARYNGEISAVINRRFLVQAQGQNLESMDTLKGFVEDLELEKLAEWEKESGNRAVVEQEGATDRNQGTIDQNTGTMDRNPGANPNTTGVQ